MSADELHKKTLEALGFRTKHGHDGYTSLTRQGKVFVKNATGHRDAWAQAPSVTALTLDALMTPLLEAMVNNRYSVELFQNDTGLGAGLRDWDKPTAPNDIWIVSTSPHENIPKTIAALFLAAVEAGLVDSKTVVL